MYIINNKYDSAFIASMSNGTIATMHYYKTQSSLLSSLSDLCWGLNYDRNKIGPPQPVCDVGLLSDYIMYDDRVDIEYKKVK